MLCLLGPFPWPHRRGHNNLPLPRWLVPVTGEAGPGLQRLDGLFWGNYPGTRVLSLPVPCGAHSAHSDHPTLSVSPLLKASSSLSVAWKLYRATDSILLPRVPSSWALSGRQLPASSAVRTVFLCFEGGFVLLKLRLNSPDREKQEAKLCRPGGWDLGHRAQAQPWGSLWAAWGVGLSPCTHVTEDKIEVSSREYCTATLPAQACVL